MSKKEKKEVKETKEVVSKTKVPSWIMDIAKSIESEGKALDMRAVSLTATNKGIRWAVSTGSLALDLASGGGWGAGRVVSPFGPEQSGKTTEAYQTIAMALMQGTVCIIFDAEQATDASYLDRIIEKVTGHSMDYYMGIIEDGKIVKAGLLYYIQPNTGENVFRMINRILKNAIPDVVKHSKRGWCWARQGRTKNDYNLEERDIGGAASALIVIDSLAALVPEAKEENDTSNPLGMMARMLSNELPKTVSYVSKKRCTLLYTNQIRAKIGGFKPGESEPGGNAPAFYSSQRCRFNGVALSTVDSVFATVGSENAEEKFVVDAESSWDGNSIDKYRYSKVKFNKNKLFSPFQETFVRWRYERNGQQGDGLDPSFDCYMYLLKTGQCSKKSGRGLSLSLLGCEDGQKLSTNFLSRIGVKSKKELESYDKNMSWQDFKYLVENPEYKMALVKHCFNQLKSGYAFSLYFATKTASLEAKKERKAKKEDKEE